MQNENQDSLSKYFGTFCAENGYSKILCVVLILDGVGQLLMLFTGATYRSFELQASVLRLTAVIILVCLACRCRRMGIVSSAVIFLTWLLFALFDVVGFLNDIFWLRSDQYKRSSISHRSCCWLRLIWYPLILGQFLLHCFADKPVYQKKLLKTETAGECPESQSSFLSRITFFWFTSLIIRGWQRSLELKDLWLLNEEDSSAHLVPMFEKRWGPKLEEFLELKKRNSSQQGVSYPGGQNSSCAKRRSEEEVTSNGAILDPEISTTTKTRNGVEERAQFLGDRNQLPPSPSLPFEAPSFIWQFFLCFKRTFLWSVVLRVCGDGLQFVGPQILKLLIRFIETPTAPLWEGYLLATVLLFCSLLNSALINQVLDVMFRIGMKLRTCLVSSVYAKALRLPGSSRKSLTIGEIVNLMSVDVQRIADASVFINNVWSIPLQISVAIYFLWQVLGPSVLAGLAVMIILAPVNALISIKMRKLQAEQMKSKDKRLKIMSEVLNGIKVIKLYAWELAFEKQILDIRNEELSTLRKSAYLSAGTAFTFIAAPFMVAAASFATFVLSDTNQRLTPEVAFVSMSLFNILRMPLTILPMVISFLVQASASNKRLKNFFASNEIDSDCTSHDVDKEFAVRVNQASFSWSGLSTEPSLSSINLQIPHGSLVAVVGQVGSGKSSLLSAILGEIHKLHGFVNVSGTVAYVSQEAWIQNASLRDNVTFIKPFDTVKYEQTISACALKTDIQQFANGDLSEIGDRGVNLSGGQKQRLSLARSVYQETDIYLLDDPLSAVDAHVGRLLFEDVIGRNGLLKNKTRILVTHGLGYLKYVDKIIVLDDGRISEVGSYAQLISNRGAFALFLENYLQQRFSESSDTGSIHTEIEDVLKDVQIESTLKERLVKRLSSVTSSSPRGAPIDTYREAINCNPLNRLRTPRSIQDSIEEAARKKFVKFVESSSIDRNRQRVSIDSIIGDESTTVTASDFVSKEKAEVGSVDIRVYLLYVRAAGILISVLAFLLFAVSSALSIGEKLWLASWSTESNASHQFDTPMRLGVYSSLGIGQALFTVAGTVLSSYSMVKASQHLHTKLLQALMRCPVSFYDTTPMGRILNRVGKDIEVLDTAMPLVFRGWILCVSGVFCTLLLIVISTPSFLIALVPLSIYYYVVQLVYITSSRALKRIESLTRSPLYSHFQETVAGAVVIRAHCAEGYFHRSAASTIDKNQVAYFATIVSARWLGIALELVGCFVTFFAALFAVTSRDEISPGLAGLSVSYAMTITQLLTWVVRMSSDLESNIVAVERIKEYIDVTPEAPWHTEHTISKSWPDNGNVRFDKLQLRYRPQLDLVLKGIDCNIKSGEKVGIVGRTGAGKSSLIAALFRLVEAEAGKILVDDSDISVVGLHDLRSRFAVIPQDPVIFSGSIRGNLDPFTKYSDAELWEVLEHAHVKELVSQLPGQLEYPVSEGGGNLSIGQRQLLCLARALLRKSKILVIDEATAAVDLETDELIQKAIRQEFANCTILTIAHRLNTVLDSDCILVLSEGGIVEMASPGNLLGNPSSTFFSMCRDAGIV